MALKGKIPTEIIPGRFKALVYGTHGVGKSHLCCEFKNAYIIDTENLSEYPDFMGQLRDNKSAVASVNDLSEIVDEVKALISTKHNYKTLIIDSLSPPYLSMCAMEADRLASKEKGTEGTEYAKNTQKPKRLLMSLAFLLSRLDMNVIVTSHEKSKFANGIEVEKTYDIPDKMGHLLGIVLHISLNGNSRKARVIKTRWRKQFPINDFMDFSNGYEEVCRRMGISVFEKDAKIEPLATNEQISEFENLCKLLSVPEETVNKWILKGQASELSELSQTTIQAMINHLKSKITNIQEKAA